MECRASEYAGLKEVAEGSDALTLLAIVKGSRSPAYPVFIVDGDCKFPQAVHSATCDECDNLMGEHPFADGCRLILPFHP